jgi:ElaB/YqjD/DUF883 family membrane-anchored ribosome-binding protein
MADDDNLQPMTGADVLPADPQGRTDAPLKDGAAAPATAARQAIRNGAGKLQQQAGDKVRQFADDGKARAGTALDQFAQLLTDAAGQVDEKLGAQYGDYARTAAGQVQTFAGSIRDKDVDALLDDARGFVRQSPAVAVGVAAALGFVVARLVQSGTESNA